MIFWNIALFAFLLNVIWEYLHLPLYDCMHRWTFKQKLIHPLTAGLLDVLIVFGVLYLAGWLVQFPGWNFNSAGFWLMHLLTGLIAGFVLERLALRLNLWSYLPAMPVLALGKSRVGISPLLQITLTPVLALYASLNFPVL